MATASRVSNIILATLMVASIWPVHPVRAQFCYEADTGVLECENITASSVDYLSAALDHIALDYDPFVVYLWYSDVTALPPDIFAGYHIVNLFVDDSWLGNAFPHDILSGITYALTWLELSVESVVALTAADMDMTLKNSVADIRMTLCNIQSIEPNAFNGYSQATDIMLSLNEIRHLEADTFTGMTSLQYLEISGSHVTTVDIGGFGQLPALTMLNLQYNDFDFLQEGVFDGLPTNFSILLAGNNFNCTCELQWLKDFINRTEQFYSSEAYCAYPTQGSFQDFDFCA